MTKRKRLSQAERLAVYNMFDGHCAYCGKPISYKEMQVDHIEPVYKDGENVMDNYFPSCRSCNFYKGTMTLDRFRNWINKIPKRLEGGVFIFRMALKYGLVEAKDKQVVFYFEKVKKNDG